MSYNVFLDDIRNPKDVTWVPLPACEWTVVRSCQEFIELVKTRGVPDFVSFDHDLADEHYRPSMYNPDRHYSNYYHNGVFKEKTGRDAALWLAEFCLNEKIRLPSWRCHSMNPIGRENIESIMNNTTRIQNEPSNTI